MKNFKNEYKELKERALNNWFIKDFINKDMEPCKLIATVIKETRDNECELGIGQDFFDFIAEYSLILVNENILGGEVVPRINKELS